MNINTKIIKHFITKNTIIIPTKNKFTREFQNRWRAHEPGTNSKILELINNINFSENKWILDAGSHVGDTLLMMSMYLIQKKINNIKLIGIEPDEEKIYFINEIIKLNNINNIELHCNAISDKNGSYSIDKIDKNSGAWTVYDDNNSKNNYITLDEVCYNKQFYLIHLDIEGYEIKAINSGINIIRTTENLILEYPHIGLDKIKEILSPKNFQYKKLSAGDVYLYNLHNFENL